MKKRGFTIIELTIALSVSLILAAVAIPRFNTLLDSQNFYSEVQQVASCIQQAQALAAAPSSTLLRLDSNGNTVSPRWTAASLSAPDANGNVTCSVIAADATTTYGNLAFTLPADQLITPITNMGISNLTITPFRLYFGVLEKGVPVAYIPSTGTIPTNTEPASGMLVTIPVVATSDSTLTATISVEQGGAPVRITTP